MRRVFVDTVYWIAMTSPRGQWHTAAVRASRALGDCHLTTTDEVLIEGFNAFSAGGSRLRREVVALARDLLADRAVTVLPQSRATFAAGLALDEARPDKGYSLTDCISMAALRERGITEVLTADGHFAQEGFIPLMG